MVVDGYCSDITRTVAFGEISEKQIEVYDTVLKAELAAIEVSRPGVPWVMLTNSPVSYSDAGYGEFFPTVLVMV